jgi:transposase
MSAVSLRYSSDITREQFERVRPLLESARKRTKPRTVDLYDVFNGVLYILKTGCQWRMLPKEYPKWRTVHEYFSIWRERDEEAKKSILEEVLKKIGWRGARTARPPEED